MKEKEGVHIQMSAFVAPPEGPPKNIPPRSPERQAIYDSLNRTIKERSEKIRLLREVKELTEK